MVGCVSEWLGSPIGRYWRNTAGSIALAFGVSLPVLVGSVGMSLDMGQAYLVRQRLGAALDASALAGAAMATEEDDIREKVEDFFAMNYPPEKIGTAYDLDVSVDGDDIIVTASADFETNFMRILGIDTFTVDEETIVVREVRGLEVALVLDITGSMDNVLANGDTRLEALQEAATSFVTILFDRTQDPDHVKIALVPYSTSVNVGRYGLGRTPNNTPWTDGEDVGVGFVENENGTLPTYSTNYSSTTGWSGCVVEPHEGGWDRLSTANDPHPNDVLSMREEGLAGAPDVVDHEGPWLPYLYDNWSSNNSSSNCPSTVLRQASCDRNGRNCTYSCYRRTSAASTNCPRSRVVPLTSDEDELLTSIAGYEARGNTMGNIGFLWGYRLLSPEPPFQQGAAWGDVNWRKVIVIMTDGANTLDSNYSALWRTRNHTVRHDPDDGPFDLDERLLESCATAKDVNGVLIYTITFDEGVTDQARETFRDCATSPAQYHDATDGNSLIEVFESISRELANLHIRS